MVASNESSQIIQMLSSEFNDLGTFSEVDIEPEDMKSTMKEVDGWICPNSSD